MGLPSFMNIYSVGEVLLQTRKVMGKCRKHPLRTWKVLSEYIWMELEMVPLTRLEYFLVNKMTLEPLRQ
jgi:hypothetical protein